MAVRSGLPRLLLSGQTTAILLDPRLLFPTSARGAPLRALQVLHNYASMA